MSIDIKFEKTIAYLLDIAKVPEDDLPLRAINNWENLNNIAVHEKISGYVASWMLDNWSQYFNLEIKSNLIEKVFHTKLRNIKIFEHIHHLANIFNKNNLKIMMLKGSAGLLREIYPIEARQTIDIDLLISNDNMEKAQNLLEKSGYNIDKTVIVPSYHHHIYPYKHDEYIGSVELHFEPYDFSMLNRPALPNIWENADCLTKNGEKFLIPSITDHVWILMRSHGFSKVSIPNFHETIEIINILSKGYTIDFDVILERSKKEMVPRLPDIVFFTSEHFFDEVFYKRISYSKIDSWKQWSYNLKIKKLKEKVFFAPERRFGCIYFLNDGNIFSKFRLLKKIISYEILSDSEKLPSFLKFKVMIKTYRYVKDLFLLFLNYFKFKVYKKF